MEDNNIENNGFENFEDQGKYKSVSTIKEKQANVIGIFSMIFYVSGFILLAVPNILQYIQVDTEGISIVADIGIGCWGIAFVAAVIGYKIKKTKITEMMLLGTVYLLGMGVLVVAGIFFFVNLLTGRVFL